MHISLGSNKGRIILLKSETLELSQEIAVFDGRKCQIRSMVLSNNGQVLCTYCVHISCDLMSLFPDYRSGAVRIGQTL